MLEQVEEDFGSNSRTIFFPILTDTACSIMSKGSLKGPENYRDLGENIRWGCAVIFGWLEYRFHSV